MGEKLKDWLGVAGPVGNLIGQGIDAFSTASMNKATRRHQIYMYDRQRADALADWTMQNDYNSPTAQMSRLKAAGLNPNLVYGNGADAISNANVRSSDTGSWNPTPISFNPGNAISAYMDLEMRQAQTDNLKAQNTVIVEDAALRKAQQIATIASAGKSVADTGNAEFDLMMKGLLKDYQITAADLSNQKQKADIKFTIDQNERAAAMQTSNLKEAAQRILTMRIANSKTEVEKDMLKKQMEGLGKDIELKQLEIDLAKLGIQKGDPFYWRVLGRVINNVTPLEKSGDTMGSAADSAGKLPPPPKGYKKPKK